MASSASMRSLGWFGAEREGRVGEGLHAADAGNLVGGGERRGLLQPAARDVGEALAVHDARGGRDSACLRASSRPCSSVSVFTISSRTASSGFGAAGQLLLDLDDVEAEGRLDDRRSPRPARARTPRHRTPAPSCRARRGRGRRPCWREPGVLGDAPARAWRSRRPSSPWRGRPRPSLRAAARAFSSASGGSLIRMCRARTSSGAVKRSSRCSS